MPQVPRKCASLLLRSDTHEPDERDMRVLLLLAYWVRYIAIPTLSFSVWYARMLAKAVFRVGLALSWS